MKHNILLLLTLHTLTSLADLPGNPHKKIGDAYNINTNFQNDNETVPILLTIISLFASTVISFIPFFVGHNMSTDMFFFYTVSSFSSSIIWIYCSMLFHNKVVFVQSVVGCVVWFVLFYRQYMKKQLTPEHVRLMKIAVCSHFVLMVLTYVMKVFGIVTLVEIEAFFFVITFTVYVFPLMTFYDRYKKRGEKLVKDESDGVSILAVDVLSFLNSCLWVWYGISVPNGYTVYIPSFVCFCLLVAYGRLGLLFMLRS